MYFHIKYEIHTKFGLKGSIFMSYLVTGGTGFIGKRVVNQLLDKGCKVISTDIDIKEKLSSINSDDFAVTDLSHSRAGIEISGLHAIDVLKKGTPLNLNNSEFTKNNCANSSYNGISFMLDFIDDQPLTFRLFCLRSFGGSFYHSITDSALEYGFIGE